MATIIVYRLLYNISHVIFVIFAIFVILQSMTVAVYGVDVPFTFERDDLDYSALTADELTEISRLQTGIPPLFNYSNEQYLELTPTGGGHGSNDSYKIRFGDLKEIFDKRVEPENDIVQRKALKLVANYSGDRTIDQICSIYTYLTNGDGIVKGWCYVADTRSFEFYRFANFTLDVGTEIGVSGIGDCDDFAILMSSLIEAIGDSTRIVLAFNNKTTIGHAYAEVYLGNLNRPEDKVPETIKWLKEMYSTNMICTHINTENKDVWLNLDWGSDETVASHPGGPFYIADLHYVLQIHEQFEKSSILPPVDRNDETSSGVFIYNITNITMTDFPYDFTRNMAFVSNGKASVRELSNRTVELGNPNSGKGVQEISSKPSRYLNGGHLLGYA